MRLSPSDLYERLLAGLADDHDIKILCILMGTKLLALVPDETRRRLDSLGEKMSAILTFKPKENAVKQELDKLGEANKAVLRLAVRLMGAFGKGAGQQGTGWRVFCEVAQKEHWPVLGALEAEARAELVS